MLGYEARTRGNAHNGKLRKKAGAVTVESRPPHRELVYQHHKVHHT